MGLFFIAFTLLFDLIISAPLPVKKLLGFLAALAFVLHTCCRMKKTKKPDLLLMLQGTVFLLYGAFFFLEETISPLYLLLAKASSAFTQLAGVLAGKPLEMGVTYSGIHLALLFVIAISATGLLCGEKSGKKIGIALGGIFLLWGVYCALWMSLAENTHFLRLNLVEPLTGPLDFRLLLFGLLYGLYRAVFKTEIAAARNTPVKTGAKKGALCAAALFTACMIFFLIPVFGDAKPEKQKNIFLWDTGLNFDLPNKEGYGLNRVGMFGALPLYLAREGYTCQIGKEITTEALENADAVVIINPLSTPDEEELKRLWEFIKKGGGLLAAGDHTGGEQIRDPLNAVLQPASIALHFDSAIPFKLLWADDFILRKSSLFQGVNDRQIQMVVGASLSAGLAAKPLVIGRGGFSDKGDSHNEAEGMLGDMRFNRGERIGDLILAAEGRYGKGRILAFGDTTHLQNTVLAYSYPFVANIFAYLTEERPEREGPKGQEKAYERALLIDAAHIENLGRDKSGDAADGLIATALRAGLTPYVNQTSPLQKAIAQTQGLDTIVLMEPAIPLSQAERTALDAFLQEGGSLFLTGDYESPKATLDIAAAYGFSFDNMALGRIAPAKNAEMALWSGCPLLYEGNLLRSGSKEIKVLMDVWNYSVIAQKQVGEGRLLIFADPDFLKNKNLEGNDSYRVGNIEFVCGLLAE